MAGGGAIPSNNSCSTIAAHLRLGKQLIRNDRLADVNNKCARNYLAPTLSCQAVRHAGRPWRA